MQKNIVIYIFLVILGLTKNVWAQNLPDSYVVKISKRVYVLHGPIQHANKDNQGYMINSTVLVGYKGVVLVGSGGTAEVGRHIKKIVEGITPKPITHVINTHHHGDHYLGNVAFPKAKIISSEKCRELVLQTGDDWLRLMERLIERKIPDTKPIAASLTYKGGTKTKVKLNGMRMVFWVPKGSHTAGDLMVYLPKDKVLIAGDILVNNVVPAMQDGVINNWIGTLEEIKKIGAEKFIPGHGPLMNFHDVEAQQKEMSIFYSAVKDGYYNDLNETEIRKSLDLTAWEQLQRNYVIGQNINRAYLEVERRFFE